VGGRSTIALALAVSVTLSGCVTAQQERMQSSLHAYVGQSIADFVALHGDPASSVKTGDNETAFRWVTSAPGVGGIVPIGGSLIVVPAGPRVCTIVLTATTVKQAPELKDWTITKWQWQGAC